MIRHLFLLALVACSGRAPSTTSAPVEPPPAAPAVRSGPSLYDLQLQLTDADARTVGLDVGRGHPVLVSMFYGSCTIACPLLLSEVQQTLAELPPELQSDTRVLLVSFDAAHDTPARLQALAHERGLDDRWTLAAASDTDARALAAVLGFKYRRLADGQFAHGSTILALDRDGRPIARVDALGQRDTLERAIAGD